MLRTAKVYLEKNSSVDFVLNTVKKPYNDMTYFALMSNVDRTKILYQPTSCKSYVKDEVARHSKTQDKMYDINRRARLILLNHRICQVELIKDIALQILDFLHQIEEQMGIPSTKRSRAYKFIVKSSADGCGLILTGSNIWHLDPLLFEAYLGYIRIAYESHTTSHNFLDTLNKNTYYNLAYKNLSKILEPQVIEEFRKTKFANWTFSTHGVGPNEVLQCHNYKNLYEEALKEKNANSPVSV